MPFKPVEQAKCPKCGKSVYAAEERVAGGYKFHKSCFKCEMCNKMLDSTNCAEHEKQLFCKVCHGRKFGPKGYGFGGGAGALSMDKGEQFGNQDAPSKAPLEPKAIAKAPEGEGCPRCGGCVYAAEQMLARGRPWHKKCFHCLTCNRTLDSTNHCDGPDKEVYCRVCYGKKFGPKGYGFGGTSGVLTSDLMEGKNDEMMNDHRPTVNLETTIKAPEGEGCPRCGGMVYAAEQMLAGRGRAWHKRCFSCRACSRFLDSVNACDGKDGDIYCRLCYGKKYGPKGYGFGCGTGFLQCDTIPDEMNQDTFLRPEFVTLNTTSIKAPEGEGCPRCGGAVFAAEQMLAKGSSWHKKCFNCCDCHRPLDSVLACDGPDKEIYCRSCYGKHFGPKGFGFGHTPTLVSTGHEDPRMAADVNPSAMGVKAPEGEGCPRCGYFVYAAEQMLSKGKVWHIRCFKCKDCARSLNSTNLCDGPDKEIYCRGCYNKHFGPKGVGYGMGAGTLTTV